MAEGLSRDRLERLADWLDAAAGRSFANCGAFAADWIETETGVHPAPWVTRLDRCQWTRELEKRRSLTAWAGAVARDAGLARLRNTDAAAPGDVGLVPGPVRPRYIAFAVMTPSRCWALWGEGSLILAAASPRLIWRV